MVCLEQRVVDLYDYIWSNIVMMKVKIAELKAKLSSFLRQVREGEEVVVTDRETPVAKIVPYQIPEERLTMYAAKKPPSIIGQLEFPRARTDMSSLDALMEDREDDLET